MTSSPVASNHTESPNQPSIFSVPTRAKDAIFGLNQAFLADSHPGKINLGIGVFKEASGKEVPTLKITSEIDKKISAAGTDPSYLPIMGHAQFAAGVQRLVMGEAAADKRIMTVQALGGTGALSLGAKLLKVMLDNTGSPKVVWLSNPTWENHRNLFEHSGFKVGEYPYYNAASGQIDFDRMLIALRSGMMPGNVVLLHACCHNPTGIDLPKEAWNELAKICLERSLIPFFDFAYQGFGEGIAQDRVGVEIFAKLGVPMLVAYSCSKNFSFYNERLGALMVLASTENELAGLKSQVEPLIRASYSNPPAHGARIVAEILDPNKPENRAAWEGELSVMLKRIQAMRTKLVDGLVAKGLPWEHVKMHKGMFSYLPMTPAQITALKHDHHIYALESGGACRVNVAALTEANLPLVIDAILKVVQS